ncbi:MAG: sugar MFS transporter [Flavobacteriales bacterium]|nr:sugar MFS transporter [Flavobacteriales bacterium]
MTSAPIRSLVMLIALFFLWGFITVLNDVLVPHWKQLFELSYTESLLVQFCFFGAYFIGSLLYSIISIRTGDPIRRIGYKRGMVYGLLLSAAGCALFAPASLLHSYPAHLGALFVLGLGFTLLQIAANPFMAIIGPPEGASSRLNLAQAFNSLGTTLAPLIGGALIFSTATPEAAVRAPYLVLAGILAGIALLVRFTHLPTPHAEDIRSDRNVLRHPPLRRGMAAIFCYVGAEVAIGSLFINFVGLPSVLGLPEETAKHFLSLYWGGAMTGRFLGAIALSGQLPLPRRITLMLAVSAAMFTLLYSLNQTGGIVLDDMLPLIGIMLLNMAAFLLAGPRPARALGLFSLVAITLLAVVIVRNGPLAMWALIAIGLFNSIMWSNIFTLAIDGLGDRTAQGSSLLVMMILGGALVPPVQGWVIERLSPLTSPSIAFHSSFVVPLLCYLYLAWYGFRGARSKAA